MLNRLCPKSKLADLANDYFRFACIDQIDPVYIRFCVDNDKVDSIVGALRALVNVGHRSAVKTQLCSLYEGSYRCNNAMQNMRRALPEKKTRFHLQFVKKSKSHPHNYRTRSD